MGTWNSDLTGVVTLPGGRLVRGRGLLGGAPEEEAVPEYGLYLTAKPHAEDGWESGWVCWPDFRLPRSSDEAIAALKDAYERSASMRVEIACDGGTGRTGSAIAILARLAGVPREDAVPWVRANYRPKAVETPWQRRFVRDVDLARGDLPR
ncbi:protein phosphatase [Microbacterium sp. HD4P20]|uniref:protein-tyrosine phosphatase family protein n=1 Tax=Microbacterium sp. HD4P20 TaxID=2864874 RepID=UPI001C643511|nr:protein-tyrosine phosphatase family protein [Microbacterium sp. HD4P20]MCP2635663.1 protein phosphatase [Microbacterium sp. HD4P20]